MSVNVTVEEHFYKSGRYIFFICLGDIKLFWVLLSTDFFFHALTGLIAMHYIYIEFFSVIY